MSLSRIAGLLHLSSLHFDLHRRSPLKSVTTDSLAIELAWSVDLIVFYNIRAGLIFLLDVCFQWLGLTILVRVRRRMYVHIVDDVFFLASQFLLSETSASDAYCLLLAAGVMPSLAVSSPTALASALLRRPCVSWSFKIVRGTPFIVYGQGWTMNSNNAW